MKLKNYVLLLILTICVGSLSAKAQSLSEENWRDVEPKTVTLYSRAKHKDKLEVYGKSTFSFKHGVRSDVGREVTRNNYELQYGGINWNGDSDWFTVAMVTDDCSRIKDLGALSWSEIFDVLYRRVLRLKKVLECRRKLKPTKNHQTDKLRELSPDTFTFYTRKIPILIFILCFAWTNLCRATKLQFLGKLCLRQSSNSSSVLAFYA
jgi:hypothetical protein